MMPELFSGILVSNIAVLSLETLKLRLYNIDFFDNTGRLIKNVKKQIAIAGKSMFEVNLNATQSKRIGFVKLSNGGYSKTIKIIY